MATHCSVEECVPPKRPGLLMQSALELYFLANYVQAQEKKNYPFNWLWFINSSIDL